MYERMYISADPGRRKGERAREERCLKNKNNNNNNNNNSKMD